MDKPAYSKPSAALNTINNAAAVITSELPYFATIFNSGLSKYVPINKVITTASKPSHHGTTCPLGSGAMACKLSKTGITARSCISKIEKPIRPTG